MSLNIQIDSFVNCSDLKTRMLVSFLSKCLIYTVFNFNLHQLSNLNATNYTTSTRSDITLQTSVKNLRAITMCSVFTSIVGMTMSLLNLLRTCIVRTKYVLRNFAYTERFFNLLKEVIISVLDASPRVKCAVFDLNKKRFQFS